jgi:hypothetical protein
MHLIPVPPGLLSQRLLAHPLRQKQAGIGDQGQLRLPSRQRPASRAARRQKTLHRHHQAHRLPRRNRSRPTRPRCKPKVPGFQTLRRHDDARSFIRGLFASSVNLRPDPASGQLHVELHGQTNPIHDATLEVIYPGTNLRLVYRSIRSAVFPRGQDV